MITCAQAEALLTLAESLEACERQNIEIGQGVLGDFELDFADTCKTFASVLQLSGMQVRLAVNALSPKQEQN